MSRHFQFQEPTISDLKGHLRKLGVFAYETFNSIVWYDVNDLEEIVPTFEGSIMMKVTRLPASAARKMASSSKRISKKPEPTSAPKQPSKPTEQTRNSPTTPAEDFFGSSVFYILQIPQLIDSCQSISCTFKFTYFCLWRYFVLVCNSL